MDSTRSLNAVIVWVLDIVVAGLFLIIGFQKILGLEGFWLQAAAMRGFPDWIRIVVGVCEVTLAVGLLIPRLSAYAALALAMLMVPAAIAQQLSGEPGVFVPIVLGVLLLFLAERRNSAGVRAMYRSIANAPHPVLRDGVIAGTIGATCVAAWFFVVDLVRGQPLYTPALLGHGVLTLLRPTPDWASSTVLVILVYTILHYLAFMAVGVLAAVMVGWARREPSVLIGFVILFAAVEVGFYGAVAVLDQATPLGNLAWYQVMIGNLIASIGMGLYLWRVHPLLHEQLRHAFG